MSGSAFRDVWAAAPWRPIRNCPGRFVTSALSDLTIEQVRGRAGIDEDAWVRLELPRLAEAQARAGRDAVDVTLFQSDIGSGGGLITYVKVDSFVHTLNTPSGLARKLWALGVRAEDVGAGDLGICLRVLDLVGGDEGNTLAPVFIPCVLAGLRAL